MNLKDAQKIYGCREIAIAETMLTKRDFDRIIEDAWYLKENLTKNADMYYLNMTDDIDAVCASKFLTKECGVPLAGFFDYRTWIVDSSIARGRIPIFVDADLRIGKCFGNHSLLFYNREGYNPNNFETEIRGRYAGSTMLALLGLYEVDFATIPKDELLLYSMLDGGYSQYMDYYPSWCFWNKFIGAENHISDILQEYTREQLNALQRRYRMTEKIRLVNNQLVWNADIQGIKERFGVDVSLPNLNLDQVKRRFREASGTYGQIPREECRRIFSSARINNETVLYSVPV